MMTSEVFGFSLQVAQQSRLVTRATTEEKTEVDVEAIVKDLQEKVCSLLGEQLLPFGQSRLKRL